jgi:hypothetical protein
MAGSHNRTVLISNVCSTPRTLVDDEKATLFRTKPCFNPSCPEKGNFRKEIYRGLSDELIFSGDLEAELI